MFKCKECGQEYEIKPDYCECGNDEFESVTQVKEQHVASSEPIPIEKEEEIRIAEPIKTYSVPKEEVSMQKSMSSGDMLSIGFLILCIILSAIILWIPIKENESDVKLKETVTPAEAKNIPPIDKFWNNTVAVPINKEDAALKLPNVINEIKIPESIQKVVTVAKTPSKTQTVSQTRTTNSTVKKQSAKPSVQNKPQSSVAKPAQNTNTQKPKTSVSSQTSQPVQKPTQPTQTPAPQTQTPQPGSGITTVTLNKNPNISTVEQANNAAALKQEFSNYKAALRNTLGRKIDFTKVVGDGSCSVAFKIDGSGRLVNRSFSKQSSNMTLNDAVYAAVMSTPSYEPPPAAYKGENLTLNIRFFNGNFEISLY